MPLDPIRRFVGRSLGIRGDKLTADRLNEIVDNLNLAASASDVAESIADVSASIPGQVTDALNDEPTILAAAEAAAETAAGPAAESAVDAEIAGRDIIETQDILEEDYAFAIVDEDGRRTWIEAATDGGLTDHAVDKISEQISGAVEADMTADGLSFAMVDEDGLRLWLEADLAGKPSTHALTLIDAGLGYEFVAGSDIPASGLRASNATPTNLAHWRKAVADVRAGVRDARILCVGDSTTWGSHTASVFANAYPTRLAAMLNRQYVPASVGLQIPADITTVVTPGVDEVGDQRWVAPADWVLSDWGFAGVASLKDTGGGGAALTFTPGYDCDTFRVWFQRNSGLGTINVSIDGGAATSESTVGALEWDYLDVSSTLSDSHVVSITATVATVAVVGIEAWDSSEKRILVGNAGEPGSTTAQWTTGLPVGRSNGILEYAPELSIISLGINDSKGVTPVATATYLANIETLIGWCQTSGDVVLATFVPSDLGATQVAAQNEYWAGLRDLADTYGCTFVDIAARFGAAPTADDLGLMADVWHPNEPGYADMAGAIYAALTIV